MKEVLAEVVRVRARSARTGLFFGAVGRVWRAVVTAGALGASLGLASCNGVVAQGEAGETTASVGQASTPCMPPPQCTVGADVVFHVDLNDDGANADAEAANCHPVGTPQTGTCRLRGVFRRAEQSACGGCRIVADLDAKIYHTDSPLLLSGGNLVLAGESSDSTVITTTSACSNAACTSLGCSDVGCGQECSRTGTHQLINAIADTGNTSTLELRSLTLRGGRNTETGAGGIGTSAGGAVVLTGGGLTLDHAVVRDNRARGLGSGIAVGFAQFLKVTDSVVSDNKNEQAVFGSSCHAGGVAGGLTGMGGGIYAGSVANVTITRSAVNHNMASDGGGAVIIGPGTAAIRNSTFSLNEGAGQGGGLRATGVNLALEFNSFIGNMAGGGGAICADCEHGAGIDIQKFTDPTTLSAFGNIVADNTLGTCDNCMLPHSPDCHVESGVTLAGKGFNLIGTGGNDCAPLGDVTEPLIGEVGSPLASNASPLPTGGSLTSVTQVRALTGASAANGAYPSDASVPAGAPICPGDDQRRFLRPQAGPCSLGAYESSAESDGDGDGIPDPIDTAPTVFSNDFSDTNLLGETTGTITTRGDQTVLVHNLDEPDGVIVEALPGGGSTPAQVSACGGTVSVTLAAGQSQTITCTRPTACIYASGLLKLNDRAKVSSDTYSNGFNLGYDAGIVGSAKSIDGGNLADRATISGNATLRGVLTGNRPGVKGTLSEHATVATQTLPPRSITSTGPSGEIVEGSSASISPGDYGDVTVRKNATLFFTIPGNYRFTSLTFDPDAKMQVFIGGKTTIGVQNNLSLGDRFRVIGESEVDFLVSGAAVTIGYDVVVKADIEAPNAAITVKDRTVYTGCLGGQTLTLGYDVKAGSGATVPTPPTITASLQVTGDWGGDYCSVLRVTNNGTTATSWIVTLNTNQSTIYNTWNGTFSGTFGSVTAKPNQSFNLTLPPGQTTTSVGFCAHRNAPGAMATITSAAPN